MYTSAEDPWTMEPHVFQLGSHVFRQLKQRAESQSILITGESGTIHYVYIYIYMYVCMYT